MDWGNDISCGGEGSSEKVGGVSGKLDSCGECCSLKCKSVGHKNVVNYLTNYCTIS